MSNSHILARIQALEHRCKLIHQELSELTRMFLKHLVGPLHLNFPPDAHVTATDLGEESSDDGEDSRRSVLSHDRATTGRDCVHHPTSSEGDRGSEDGSPSF